MLLFAVAISAAFGCLSKHTAWERFKYSLWALLAFLAVGIAVGWLMYPFTR